MKVLNFTFRGEHYQVNEEGHIKRGDSKEFSTKWLFLGGMKHHWGNRITTTRDEAFKNPELLEKCLGWDLDHGTKRLWGGSYNGKLPRITNVYVKDE